MNYKDMHKEIAAIEKGEKAAAEEIRMNYGANGEAVFTELDPEEERQKRAARLVQALPARQKARMTQTAFAQRIGVSQTTVANWERGKTPTGAARKLLALLEKHPELIKEIP